jgi:hypothetical protein
MKIVERLQFHCLPPLQALVRRVSSAGAGSGNRRSLSLILIGFQRHRI